MKLNRPGLILLLMFVSFFLFSCATTRVRSIAADQTESDLFARVKPVFIIPSSDLDKGNGIEAVFFNQVETEDGAVIEITVIFYDEDHPSGLVDGLYDIYRRFKYRRVRDVETFFFHFNIAGVGASRFDFPGTYAREQVFSERKVEHFSAEVPAGEFEYIQSRPVIHVTTWNHLFREKATEPDIVTVAVGDYPVYPGTREDAENLLRR